MNRKGIILAGGTGSRLFPATLPVSKHLLSVYDKPMIYYPLALLMFTGVTEIILITTPNDNAAFRRLLGDGRQWGCRFEYAVQDEPNGIAEALLIAEDFLDGNSSILALGDNIFHGDSLQSLFDLAGERETGATIFGHAVSDPSAYGNIALAKDGRILSIEEKPEQEKSPYAVTGLYFYDNDAPAIAKKLKPSARGELEITDLNRIYLERGDLSVELMGRGFAWFDTGTPDALLSAANFVQLIEQRQGTKIWCPEEIAWRKGSIDDDALVELAQSLLQSGYGDYLLSLLEEATR